MAAALDAAIATGKHVDNKKQKRNPTPMTSSSKPDAPVVKKACGGHVRHLAAIEWKYLVFEDSTPNAMVLPDGSVLVHTGLLRLFGCNEVRRSGSLGYRAILILHTSCIYNIHRICTFI